MTDSWDERRKAQEESYFEQANKEALARLARRKEQPSRLSPATGSPMDQVALLGVVVDVCRSSGGIWLDAGELEQLTHTTAGSVKALQELLASLPKNASTAAKHASPLSPITGKPLVSQKFGTISVSFCEDTKGIWLDAHQLEQIVQTAQQTLGGSLKAFVLQVLGKQ
jgi:Zn-finger nucleic acid-binding protein